MTDLAIKPRRRTAGRNATDARAIWNSMPGWGLAANLTPPELLDKRSLAALRRRIAAAVLVCVVLIVAGYAFGRTRISSAEDELHAAQSRAAALHVQQAKYSRVTLTKTQIAQIHQQLSVVLQRDVDLGPLLGRLDTVRPNGVTLTGADLTVDTGAAGASMTGSLDGSGLTHIGKVQLTATGRQLTDASAYAVALAKVPGVVDVLPTSNATQNGAGTEFTITFSLTSKALSGRYAK